MSRRLLHCIMLLPILAATFLTFSTEPVAALSPDQVVGFDYPSAEADASSQEQVVAKLD